VTQPDPPFDSVELTAVADERTVLEAFLDYQREAVLRKVRGLSEEDARRRLVASATTPGGIVKHLRWVEMNWFQRVLAGRPHADLPTPPWTDEDPDADFRLEPDERLDQVIAEYEAECARSRQTAAGHSLDDTGQHRRLGKVSLRWIYVHMIEETARHAGHADILREQIDGTTGD
jgi:uncharacterized damage-inducible protein DinB